MILEHATLSDTGRVRRHNEDRCAAYPEEGLFVVADGIGGGPAGEVAAQIVVDLLPDYLTRALGGRAAIVDDAERPLTSALATISAHIRSSSRDNLRLAGMGTTAVIALIRAGEALVAHLGDSRAYLWRQHHLTQLTRDHSIVQVLVDTHEIAPEDAAQHPSRGFLTRYVGMSSTPRPDVTRVPLSPGDCLLLCTDGLTNMVEAEDCATILERNTTLDGACRALVQSANEAGGHDNITVAIIRIAAEPGRAPAHRRLPPVR